MSNKQRNLLIAFTFILLTMLLSACTQSLSAAPAKTPTIVVTSAFVSPLPPGQNPMDTIAQFAQQTAAAQTAIAGGATPQPIAITPSAAVMTPILAVTPGTPTNAAGVPTASGANPTAVPSGVRPATYTLQNGEFPYCIARRFNVDPDQLLSLSGMTSPDVYYQGQVLKIPQSGAFPGSRALLAHPGNYTVLSSDETLYSIACKYGDVDPAAIASLNGVSAGAKLSAGQQIKIP
jgi:LysM repeat protein